MIYISKKLSKIKKDIIKTSINIKDFLLSKKLLFIFYNKSLIYIIIILYIFFNYFLIDFIISLFIRIFDAFSQDYCIKIIKNIFLDINFNSINFFNHFHQKETIIFIIIISISHDNIKILRK